MPNPRSLPGPPAPGPDDRGPHTPGPEQPDPSHITTETVEQTGVAIDSTGSTTIGSPSTIGGDVIVVEVNADQADFDFNIELDGTDIFNSEQSPTGTTLERFYPDPQLAEFDGTDPTLEIDVSDASSTGAATADVTVDVGVEEQT